MTLFCSCGSVKLKPSVESCKIRNDPILPPCMNQAKTIQVNPRKIKNDSILPNPAETVSKNLLKFADNPILLLWMNQPKSI